MLIEITATAETLTPQIITTKPRGSFGDDKISFNFSSDWDSRNIVVTFHPVRGRPVKVPYLGFPIDIPAEVTRSDGKCRYVVSGTIVSKDRSEVTSKLVSLVGYISVPFTISDEGGNTSKVTPDTYDKFLDEAKGYIEKTLQDAKDSGEFDGPPGRPGGDGAPGQQGRPGNDGEPGRDGKDGKNAEIKGATADIDETSGKPQVFVTAGGTPTERTFNFSFSGLKGMDGGIGPTGHKGERGDSGVFVGKGTPPPGTKIQIDPDGEETDASDISAVVPEGLNAEPNVQAVLEAINKKPSGGAISASDLSATVPKQLPAGTEQNAQAVMNASVDYSDTKQISGDYIKQGDIADWATLQLFDKKNFVKKAGCEFVRINGIDYFQYWAGPNNFRLNIPNAKQGSVSITILARKKDINIPRESNIFIHYKDGTEEFLALADGKIHVKETNPSKTVEYIRGNYDLESNALIDLSVLSIMPLYDVPIPGGGGGGVTDHADLTGREKPDQHPMSAITGLETALMGKQPKGDYITQEADPTVPEWAKQPTKPTYTAAEVGALPKETKIPNVPEWALNPQKPTYKAGEVGAVVPAGLTAEANVQAILEALNAKPGGGGEKPWKLINQDEIELGGETREIKIDRDSYGLPFSLKEVRVYVFGKYKSPSGWNLNVKCSSNPQYQEIYHNFGLSGSSVTESGLWSIMSAKHISGLFWEVIIEPNVASEIAPKNVQTTSAAVFKYNTWSAKPDGDIRGISVILFASDVWSAGTKVVVFGR